MCTDLSSSDPKPAQGDASSTFRMRTDSDHTAVSSAVTCRSARLPHSVGGATEPSTLRCTSKNNMHLQVVLEVKKLGGSFWHTPAFIVVKRLLENQSQEEKENNLVIPWLHPQAAGERQQELLRRLAASEQLAQALEQCCNRAEKARESAEAAACELQVGAIIYLSTQAGSLSPEPTGKRACTAVE